MKNIFKRELPKPAFLEGPEGRRVKYYKTIEEISRAYNEELCRCRHIIGHRATDDQVRKWMKTNQPAALLAELMLIYQEANAKSHEAGNNSLTATMDAQAAIVAHQTKLAKQGKI